MTAGHIAVVGASLAGVRTVRALRMRGHDGPITLIGDEPHRAYDRPPLSKQVLTGDMPAEDTALESDDLYEGLDLRLGVRATALRPAERRIELSDGSSVGAEHVVVATGSSPRRLPGTDAIAGVLALRTLDDAQAIRAAFLAGARVVVVGAGFIGSEVASSARACGLDVTLVEPLPAPVVRGVGERIGGAIADLHRAGGVDLRLGVGVDEVLQVDGRAVGVRLGDGTEVAADLVVVGIGVVPNTGWLEGSGLTLDNGVVCDDRLRAVGGGGHVWAAGDVARWPSALAGGSVRVEHWTNATEQAMAVATGIVTGDDAPPFDPVPYVWSDLHGTKVQILGFVSGADDVEIAAGSLESGRWLATYLRDGVLRGVAGMGWPRAVMRARPLIEARADADQARAYAAGL